MTETMARPPEAARGDGSVGHVRRAVTAGAAAGTTSAVVGLLLAGGLAVLAWIPDGAGRASSALRAGAIGWLVGNGSGVQVGAAVLNAVPLGVLLVAVVVLVVVSSRFSAALGVPASPVPLVVAAATCAAVYGAALAVTALWASSGLARVDPVRAAVAGVVTGGLCGLVGAAHGTGAARAVARRLPPSVVGAARAGAWGAVAVLVAGTALVLGGLVVRLETAQTLWSRLDPGPAGGLGLLLVCLLVLPNLVLWSVAMLLGPGFAVGSTTSVTLGSSTLGAIPALPLLAWIPPDGPRPGWLVGLGVVPLLAGMLAGYLATRSQPTDPAAAVGLGAGAGAFGGALLGLGLALSGGAAGPGRLAHTGPDLATTVPLAIAVLAVGGALGGAVGHYRGRRGAHDAEPAVAPDGADG